MKYKKMADDLSDIISEAEDALHPDYRVDAEHSLTECVENMTKKLQWYNKTIREYMRQHTADMAELRDRGWRESGTNGR